MTGKSVQLGFRCTEETRRKLRDLSHQLDVPVQQLIEQGVETFLSSKDQSLGVAPSLGVLKAREEAFLLEMLSFHRSAPADLIREMRSMAMTVSKLWRARQDQTE